MKLFSQIIKTCLVLTIIFISKNYSQAEYIDTYLEGMKITAIKNDGVDIWVTTEGNGIYKYIKWKNKWINFYDLEDKVAINYNLADDFMPNSKNLAIEDIEVNNDYEYEGESNPHKLYGYLRTPEVSRAIMEFLQADRRRVQLWMDHILYWMQKLIKR